MERAMTGSDGSGTMERLKGNRMMRGGETLGTTERE